MDTTASPLHPAVDLVIVIDTSASMQDEAEALNRTAEAAIATAQASCPSDLRVVWLGIEGTWRETHFNRTLRQYLTEACHAPEAALRGRKRGEVPGGGAQEDAARAIEDIAHHFAWRPEARRAMFYLGDEALEGGGNAVEPKDIEAADRAIQAAREAGVMVHTYFGTTRSPHKAALQQEYARVAQETGGQAFTEHDALDGFAAVLAQVICTTRNHEAVAAAAPMLTESLEAPSEAVQEPAAPSAPPDVTAEAPPTPVQAPEPEPHVTPEGQLTPAQRLARHNKALVLLRRYVIGAMAIGTLPLPLFDFAALIALKIRMVMQLSKLYDVPFSDNRDRAILFSLVVPLIPSFTRRWALSLVKFTPVAGYIVGTVAMSSVAGVVIYALGRAFMHHFEQGHSFLTLRLEDIKQDMQTFWGEGKQAVTALRQRTTSQTAGAQPAP